MIEITILHSLKNIKHIFLAVLLTKSFVVMVVLYGGKNAIYRFIKTVIKGYDYCRGVIKKRFNKNSIMSAKDKERFQSSNICRICGKLFDAGNNKVTDLCPETGKYRGSAHWSCNINLKLI